MRGPLACLVAALAAFAGVGGASAATLSNCPDYNPPNELVLLGGTPQTAKLGNPFDAQLQVTLANTNGCAVTSSMAGVAVTFSAPGSGPSGTFSSSGTNAVLVGTDASGSASAPQFTANRFGGGYLVVASSQYGSVEFSLVNTASGVPSTIAPVAASQSATVGDRYSLPLQVTVLDANGNPVAGAGVTFSLGGATGGGGGAGATFDGGSTQATEQTDATGTATSPLFTADTTAGPFSASATTAGIVEPATFILRNLAGKPPAIAPLAPTRQTAIVGAEYGKPLRLRVLDAGKPVQGATVTFALGSGGASGAAAAGASFVGGATQATETTNASGVAVSPRFVANTVAGAFTATATTEGTTAAASFSLDNLTGKAASIRGTVGAKQSVVVGGRYARPLEVEVRNGRGKPVQGATVTFTVGAAGATGSTAGATFPGGVAQATETTNADGLAVSPRPIANTIAGSFTVTATTSAAPNAASFDLRNRPSSPDSITAGVASSESAAPGARFAVPLAVTVDDAHGNPVPGIHVTFTAPADGPTGRFSHGRRSVSVVTDAHGIAVAPPLHAGGVQGGFVVRASAAGHSAAFALVVVAT